MTTLPPVVVSVGSGRMSCDVPAMPGWSGLETLWLYLEQHFDAISVSRVDGPDARCWIVRVRGIELSLVHEDPWGNMIVSSSPQGDTLLQEIADDLRARLA